MTDERQMPTIRRLQQLEYEALKEILKIANNQRIPIFLRGGSVMGAVKYHGFVPWDDDIDIAVPREWYEPLITGLKENLPQQFYVAWYRYGDEIHSYFPRIIASDQDRRSLNLQRNNHLGLCIIDILPLDGAPANRLRRFLYILRVLAIKGMAATHTVSVTDTVTLHRPIIQIALRFLRRLPMIQSRSQDELYDALDALYNKYQYGRTGWSGTITGSLFYRELFPDKVWGDGVEAAFGDLTVKIPTEFDLYLKKLYGRNFASVEPREKKSHLVDKRI